MKRGVEPTAMQAHDRAKAANLASGIAKRFVPFEGVDFELPGRDAIRKAPSFGAWSTPGSVAAIDDGKFRRRCGVMDEDCEDLTRQQVNL